MKGAELKHIRQELGMSAVALGRALGYAGNDNTIRVTIWRYETGRKPIPPWIPERLAKIGGREP